MGNFLDYYTLKSLSLFSLAESVQWILEFSRWLHIAEDYTIIMPRTLKVTGNHVMYDRGPRLRALCCLSSLKKQNHDFHFFVVQCIIKMSCYWFVNPVILYSVITATCHVHAKGSGELCGAESRFNNIRFNDKRRKSSDTQFFNFLIF